MREIEIRRHSCTKKGSARGKGSHLSRDGVRLAREVAASMGAFDLVVASSIPRTIETALAMGFSVDATISAPEELAGSAMSEIGHHERWSWEEPWGRFAGMARASGPVADFGSWLRDAWTASLESASEGGRLLIVSHGRDIETGVVTCLDDRKPVDFADWGESLHQCEGVRMSYQDGRFFNPVVLRTRRCVDQHPA